MQLVPTSAHLKEEIDRRAGSLEVEAPQCEHWNREKLVKWLKENPIQDLNDCKWMLAEEKKVCDMLATSARECEGPSSWTDLKAVCQIYCALCD